MSEINNAFRTKLYNWRMANNLNQREAAVSLGCQQNQIWRSTPQKAWPSRWSSRSRPCRPSQRR